MPDTDARLSKIESKLDKIDVTLTKIAVQDDMQLAFARNHPFS